MGEKKKKEAETAKWKKVLVVGACVLFVVLMIVSGMGYGWLSMFSCKTRVNAVVIDYTIYNGAGNPIVTTDQQTVQQTGIQWKGVLAANRLPLLPNQTLTDTRSTRSRYILR